MDSLLLVPRLSASLKMDLLIMALPTLLPLPPLAPPPAFPPTPTVLLPSLVPNPRALRRTPPVLVSAGPSGGPTSGLSPLVTSTDEASTTRWSLPLTYTIHHVPWCVLMNIFDFVFQLTRHPFRLPCTARPLFHIFLFHISPTTSHERCAQVAPIHLLVKCRKIGVLNPGYNPIGLDFSPWPRIWENLIVSPGSPCHPFFPSLSHVFVSRLRLGYCMLQVVLI